jgi:hypothetical protein
MHFTEGGGARRKERMMKIEPGQQLVWNYKPKHRMGRIPVDVEVVQPGSLRTRVRIARSNGGRGLRWVHPKNLRSKAPDEPAYPYPLH